MHPQPPTDLETRHIGQLQVQHDDVGRSLISLLQRGLTRRSGDNGVAGSLQKEGPGLKGVRIVVDEQNLFGGYFRGGGKSAQSICALFAVRGRGLSVHGRSARIRVMRIVDHVVERTVDARRRLDDLDSRRSRDALR